MVHEVEDFYGVYLLYCLNPKFKGRVYIGYTVNPNRRIKQHNTGAHAGGAYRTNGRGPWEMVLIIHGFPNDVSGLRFEWAWQNPNKSRRLRGVPGKSKKESAFQYRWRVVCNMLRTAPWSGLSLTVRWLKQEYQQDFPIGLQPPLHMPVCFGPVMSKKVKNSSNRQKQQSNKDSLSESVEPSTSEMRVASQDIPSHCTVCKYQILSEDKYLTCLHPSCSMIAHLICLAQHFLKDPSKLLPVEGQCPLCKINLLWGELVRQRKGCYRDLPGSVLQSSNDSGNDKFVSIEENDNDSS